MKSNISELKSRKALFIAAVALLAAAAVTAGSCLAFFVPGSAAKTVISLREAFEKYDSIYDVIDSQPTDKPASELITKSIAVHESKMMMKLPNTFDDAQGRHNDPKRTIEWAEYCFGEIEVIRRAANSDMIYLVYRFSDSESYVYKGKFPKYDGAYLYLFFENTAEKGEPEKWIFRQQYYVKDCLSSADYASLKAGESLYNDFCEINTLHSKQHLDDDKVFLSSVGQPNMEQHYKAVASYLGARNCDIRHNSGLNNIKYCILSDGLLEVVSHVDGGVFRITELNFTEGCPILSQDFPPKAD